MLGDLRCTEQLLTSRRLARLGALVALCLTALAAADVRPAAAGLGSALAGCDAPLSQPFLPWLDPGFYTPVGSFESSGQSWQLAGAASLVAGNEPWRVSGVGTQSLGLRQGASALSSPFCIGLLSPTLRLFARSASPLLPSTMVVSVQIDLGAASLTVPVGVVTALPLWAPSLPLPLLANVTSVLGGSSATARIQLTALTGETRVDDVFVDPFKTS